MVRSNGITQAIGALPLGSPDLEPFLADDGQSSRDPYLPEKGSYARFRDSGRRRCDPKFDFDTAHWRDTGCKESPTCLECPLPVCRYEDPVWYQRLEKARRDQKIVALFETNDGANRAAVVAKVVGVSERTVHRALKKAYA